MQISRITSFTPVFYGNSIQEENKNIQKPELHLYKNEQVNKKQCSDKTQMERVNAQVKKMLDNSSFVFDTDDGAKVMTIKEFVKNNIYGERNKDEQKVYYYTSEIFAKELADKGFDDSKILRTKYGPGIKLTETKHDGKNGSVRLEFNLKGNGAEFNPKWYSRIFNSCASDRITEFTGSERTKADKALDEYLRNLLTKDMGIDFGYVNDEIICFNPKSISNVNN